MAAPRASFAQTRIANLKPLSENRAGRLLHFLAEAVFHHPRWFWYSQVLLVLVCLGYTVARLQFSTDKNDLISVRESYRREFLEFKREFKIHDNLFVLIESESRDKNREFVERLAARLQVDGQFTDVLLSGRIKADGTEGVAISAGRNPGRLAAQSMDQSALVPHFFTSYKP